MTMIKCPDCGEPIPDGAVEGSECEGCGNQLWDCDIIELGSSIDDEVELVPEPS